MPKLDAKEPEEDRVTCCSRLCRFNAECASPSPMPQTPRRLDQSSNLGRRRRLFTPLKHIDECSEWKGILCGQPKDVGLAYVSVNLIIFWLEVAGAVTLFFCQLWLGLVTALLGWDLQLDPLQTLVESILAAYCVAYFVFLLVRAAETSCTLTFAALIYVAYASLCGLVAWILSALHMFYVPMLIYGAKAFMSGLCALLVLKLRNIEKAEPAAGATICESNAPPSSPPTRLGKAREQAAKVLRAPLEGLKRTKTALGGQSGAALV